MYHDRIRYHQRRLDLGTGLFSDPNSNDRSEMQIGTFDIATQDLIRHVGRIEQVADVRLLEFADGSGRGARVLDFRTSMGLRFDVLVDRGFDIGRCDFRGVSIAWQSAVGTSAPWFAESDGLGWLRTFGGGLMTTCGFEHTLFPASGEGSRFAYPARDSVTYGLHGRISNRPARLSGYGIASVEGREILWAEGVVEQAAVYGEALRLTRRIEVHADGSQISVIDRVSNFGYASTPTMVLYHLNLGFPLVADGAQVLMDVAEARDGTGAAPPEDYLTIPPPSHLSPEEGYEHQLVGHEDGWVSSSLINERLGVGFRECHDPSTLPYTFLWRSLRDGMYVVGLEPCSVPIEGRDAAIDAGVPLELAPGESREYKLVLEPFAL